tara:strand:+ start:150 stop:350 length:201 start_codon:yes stop_codon:yes gene_type:complete
MATDLRSLTRERSVRCEVLERVFTGTEYEEVYYDRAFDYDMNRDIPPHVVVQESDVEFSVFPPYTY